MENTNSIEKSPLQKFKEMQALVVNDWMSTYLEPDLGSKMLMTDLFDHYCERYNQAKLLKRKTFANIVKQRLLQGEEPVSFSYKGQSSVMGIRLRKSV